MRDRQRTAQHRRLRGWILRLLADEYPGSVELDALAVSLRSVFPSLSRHELDVETEYLDEKGYVARAEQEVMGEEIVMVRLTAQGRDLLEGNGPGDPAITTRLVG